MDRHLRSRIGAGLVAAAIAVSAALIISALMVAARPAMAAGLIPKSSEVASLASAALDKPLAAGRTSILAVTAEVIPGWHINSDRPLNPDFIPTRLTVAPGGDDIKVGEVQYPPAELLALSFSGGDKLTVFTGSLKFSVPLKPAASFKPRPSIPTTITLDFQPCNDNECLRPASVSMSVDLASAAPKSAGLTGGDAQEGGSGGGGSGIGEAALANVFQSHGYLLGFILVLLGGLALNLTPCVYPLIAVTIAYFGVQSGTSRRVVTLALTYVLGIALMFSGVGVAVALSGGLFGAALQNPYVLAAIATMLLALAASSFGWFSIQPPQWMMQRAGVARPGYAGALLMGLSMGVVAAPCIGPVVLGLLLLVERSQSALFGFALFFTLAVGMGLPYVALALAAGSIRRLPRSGEWLRWIEQLFGFVLTGLALYFIDPIVPGHIISRLLPFYAAATGVFLGFLTPAGRDWQPFFVIRLGLGAVSAAAFVYLLIPGRPAAAMLEFKPYDGSLLTSAKEGGKPVVIDFAADWCIPCHEMDRTTYVDPEVVGEAPRFVWLRADLTAKDRKTDALVDKFEIQGVPTTVFIDSQGKIRKRIAGYIGPREFLSDLHQLD
jgi:thioredoxin:protein disulfide reductase